MIGESLAFCAQNRFGGAFGVFDAELRADAVPEIELG
jgi:hypothetical protein